MKKYSEACEQNKLPILSVLKEVFQNSESILEVGSGTGQHAIYFSNQLKHLTWQPSDLAENLPSILEWIHDTDLDNLKSPIELDVQAPPAGLDVFDGIFTANTLHIMSWSMIESFFSLIPRLLSYRGKLLIYGPFAYQGEHTSPSNARFDQYLKQQNPHSGVRDIEDLKKLAEEQGMALVEDYDMPANNRCLLWQTNS